MTGTEMLRWLWQISREAGILYLAWLMQTLYMLGLIVK